MEIRQRAERPAILTDEERIIAARWILDRRNTLIDREVSKETFWKGCIDWIRSQFGKAVGNAENLVEQLDEAFQIEIKSERVDSNRGRNGNSLRATLRKEWHEFRPALDHEGTWERPLEIGSDTDDDDEQEAPVRQPLDRPQTSGGPRKRKASETEGSPLVSVVINQQQLNSRIRAATVAPGDSRSNKDRGKQIKRLRNDFKAAREALSEGVELVACPPPLMQVKKLLTQLGEAHKELAKIFGQAEQKMGQAGKRLHNADGTLAELGQDAWRV